MERYSAQLTNHRSGSTDSVDSTIVNTIPTIKSCRSTMIQQLRNTVLAKMYDRLYRIEYAENSGIHRNKQAKEETAAMIGDGS